MKKIPDIGIAYSKGMRTLPFDEFEKGVASEGLVVISEEQPDRGGYACPEWFIWPLAAVFIGKPYFDAFLKEAGKDHYHILKEKLSKLTNEVTGKGELEPVLIGSEGKLSSNNPFSLVFSVYAEAHDGNRFKLLIPKSADNHYCEKAVSCFLAFVNDFHDGNAFLDDIDFDGSRPVPGKHIFVHFNQDSNSIEWLDESKYR